jgi:hypothetical protein
MSFPRRRESRINSGCPATAGHERNDISQNEINLRYFDKCIYFVGQDPRDPANIRTNLPEKAQFLASALLYRGAGMDAAHQNV